MSDLVEEIAKAIGRTRTDLDDDEPCDASCETDGGTCICVELYYEQAKSALAVMRPKLDRLRAEVAKTRLDLLAAQVERDQYKQWLKDREPPPNLHSTRTAPGNKQLPEAELDYDRVNDPRPPGNF